MNQYRPSRREFLKSGAIVGGGLVIGFTLGGCDPAQMPPVDTISGSFLPNAFLQITPESEVIFYCPRDEMGQGITTGLATLIGEELGMDPADIHLRFAGVHADYNNPEMGLQATGGSTSMKAHYYQLRQVAANVREAMISAAAKDLGVKPEAVGIEDGEVVAAGKRHALGDFVATAAVTPVPEEAPLKDAASFRYIGKEMPRIDSVAKATGTAEFGMDIDIPGMFHAVISRGPVVGGQVVSYNEETVSKMPGVTDVVQIESGVAVVAEKFWQANQAAQALEVEWKLLAAPVNTAQIRADYQQALDGEDGVSTSGEGDIEAGFAGSAHLIENQYWTPFLAHAPMEPMNAVVRVNKEKGEADLWSGTQGPVGAQGLVARYAGLDPDKVRVHSTYLGGAFGRRGVLSHVVEATQVAVATGKTIKLVWTRPDDIKNGVYRPASLMKIKAGVDGDGRITAWQARRVGANITPDILRNTLPGVTHGIPEGVISWLADTSNSVFSNLLVDYSSIEGLFEDYDLPNREITHVTRNHSVPVSYWRSVGHSFTAFAKEMAIDELAEKAGLHPVELRVRNTKRNPRLKAVMEVARDRMNSMKVADGHQLGFAAHGSFGSHVAEVAEVSVANDKIRVHKVLCVVDCGIAVNPDIIRAQMEGAIMYGLTAALYGNLEIEQGEIRESNFHDYPILRMDEAPHVEVVIMESSADPTGVGEPGLPPIAPAVANAVYAATGRRLTSLPLKLA